MAQRRYRKSGGGISIAEIRIRRCMFWKKKSRPWKVPKPIRLLLREWGSVSTIAGPPRTTGHVEFTEEQRKLLGIPESLIRYSVGIENAEDLIVDLDHALAAL